MEGRRILHYFSSLQIDTGQELDHAPEIVVPSARLERGAAAAHPKARRIGGQPMMEDEMIDIGERPGQKEPPPGNA